MEWYVSLSAVLTAVAAAVVAAGIIYKKAVVPIVRGLWSAIIAAPLIATGLDELVELVRGNVLYRLDQDGAKIEGHADALDSHEHRIERAEFTLLDHEERIGKLEPPGKDGGEHGSA